jgi:hypothetical protein
MFFISNGIVSCRIVSSHVMYSYVTSSHIVSVMSNRVVSNRVVSNHGILNLVMLSYQLSSNIKDNLTYISADRGNMDCNTSKPSHVIFVMSNRVVS